MWGASVPSKGWGSTPSFKKEGTASEWTSCARTSIHLSKKCSNASSSKKKTIHEAHFPISS